jgi:hypothetical protein
MARTRRLSTTAALIVCLVGTQWTGTLFASEEDLPPSTTEHLRFTLNDDVLAANPPAERAGARVWRRPLEFAPRESSTFAQRGRRGGGGGRNGNGGAAAELMLGAVAAVAGAAVLVYANRPECNGNPTASGCGYGTKVVGGAVLSIGIVGIIVGAARWR